MNFHKALISVTGVIAIVPVLLSGCGPKPGTVKDEAMLAGRTGDTFPAAEEDYFADMDGGYRRATDPTINARRRRGPRPQHLDRVDRRQ